MLSRKSKLRKPETINLGKQYAGSMVSRDALDAESDDDPFKGRSSEGEDDSHEDEEEELESGDEDVSDANAVKIPTRTKASSKKSGQEPKEEFEDEIDGSDDIEGSEEESENSFDEEMGSVGSEEDEDDEDDDDDEEEDDDEKHPRDTKSNDREELRQLMATDQKTIASSISQAAKADATKGRAVKQQRSTFDALLNTRIKLQKGLTAVNQLTIATKDSEDVDSEAVKSAESAALALWSTLEDLRYALADAQSGEPKKRKRPSPVSSTTSTASLWKRMTELESESVNNRRTVLDKWSSKVRGSGAASLPNARGKLLGSGTSGQQTITAVLDAQLATEAGERSAKRARNASANGTSTSGESHEPIYDDTAFYQTLLRELVEQRMSSDSITNGLDTLHIQLPSKLSLHPVTGMRNDKNRRQNVDSRATKGRKMRYDVHEKLQNFMAPEDRGTWTTHARDEFFASLLGRTASGLLGEGDDEDASAGEESGDDREEIGLRLFRS